MLPEILQVYLLLNGLKLHPGQLLQLLATTEQMAAAHGATQVRMQDGYDHSYYFIATFMEEHMNFHAKALFGN